MSTEDGSPTTPTKKSSHLDKKPPAHLSEFYSIVYHGNNNNNNNNNNTVLQSPVSTATRSTTTTNRSNIINPSFVSSSSNFSSYTNDVLYDSPDHVMVLTVRDMMKVISKYETALQKASKYAELIQQLSVASSEFGESLEEIAKAPGCDDMGQDFYKISGLQFVNSNYESILSKMVIKEFVEPIRDKLKNFKQLELEKDETFKNDLKLKLARLKSKEKDLKNFNKLGRKKMDLNIYKHNLISITQELDSIENFKKMNYSDLLQDLTRLHSQILLNLSKIVRSQLEINETIAKKSWSGGGLDELVSKCPDPFNTEEDEEAEEDGGLEDLEEETLNDIVDLNSPGTDQQQGNQAAQHDGDSPTASASSSSSINNDNSFSLPIIPDADVI